MVFILKQYVTFENLEYCDQQKNLGSISLALFAADNCWKNKQQKETTLRNILAAFLALTEALENNISSEISIQFLSFYAILVRYENNTLWCTGAALNLKNAGGLFFWLKLE